MVFMGVEVFPGQCFELKGCRELKVKYDGPK